MAVNIRQAFKMAWKSIWGKKGRSALTILGIFIGIAAVMTIVSVMEGMQAKSMEQFEAMGSNRVNVRVDSWVYDDQGNNIGKDYFPDLYDYCTQMKDVVLGVTPKGECSATVTYGTKSSDTMQPQYNENGQVSSGSYPPRLFYGSDQFSICENLTLKAGRDLTMLDIKNYNQVCVINEYAAKLFFGGVDPVGQILKFNGNEFRVVGVYANRLDANSQEAMWSDNMIVLPYSTRRLLGGQMSTEYVVKVADAKAMPEVISRIGGFLRGIVDSSTGSVSVFSESQWAESSNEYLRMVGLVLGGIAAISLLVGGIGIMNIMLVTVTERTREIGIRRAIGAQRGSIISQFLIEAAMLCGIGGIVGILFGTIGSVFLSTLLVKMTIYPSPIVAAGAFGLSVALGVIFGSYPAVKASKLQPVEALRAE